MTQHDRSETSPARRALILGASGGIGGAITAALVRHGWTTRAMVRDIDKARAAAAERGRLAATTFVAGDAMKREDVIRAATEGSGVDVIVHAVNPPGYRRWETLVLPMLDNSIAAACEAGGARIVVPGTVYNYDPGTTPVIDEHVPQNTTIRKGRIRVEMENRLRTAAPTVPSLILRAGDFFGPGARSSWFAQAMLKPGRPVQAITNIAPGVPHAYAYLPDLADAFARLLDCPDRLRPHERLQFSGHWDADGQAMQRAVSDAVGRDIKENAFPWWLMRLLAPFGGFAREALEVEPVWRHSMRLDNTRLVALLGAEPHTALDEAIWQTLIDMGCISASLHSDRSMR